jgi:hypothetical protein
MVAFLGLGVTQMRRIAMRKLTLVATAAMFIGAQAALAAPLPTASGQQLRGIDSPIITIKKKKKMKHGMSGMQGGMGAQGDMKGGMQGGQMGGDTGMKKQ